MYSIVMSVPLPTTYFKLRLLMKLVVCLIEILENPSKLGKTKKPINRTSVDCTLCMDNLVTPTLDRIQTRRLHDYD